MFRTGFMGGQSITDSASLCFSTYAFTTSGAYLGRLSIVASQTLSGWYCMVDQTSLHFSMAITPPHHMLPLIFQWVWHLWVTFGGFFMFDWFICQCSEFISCFRESAFGSNLQPTTQMLVTLRKPGELLVKTAIKMKFGSLEAKYKERSGRLKLLHCPVCVRC